MSGEITNWLKELGLDRYADVFVDNDVDLRTLPELTEEDLKALGLSLGHRRALQKAIKDLSQRVHPPCAPPFAPPTGSDGHLAAWERQPGERKPVTMLFADVTDSTALTEKLDAEETHDLLYGATRRMCAAVENNRGTVCRFMGDGLMAMFGAPVASEQHALDACEAALQMQHAIRDYSASVETRHGARLQIRVGLHSGEVVVLTVGEGDKVEYDASGPTVPIAARMEQSAPPGEICLTASTRALAEERIEAQPLGSVAVKGISEPVERFALRRVRSAEEISASVARTPFVGRRGELKRFRRTLDACVEVGQGRTVYVRGEAGIGKTRLIEEFMRIASAEGASIHRVLELPFGVGKGQDAIRSLAVSLLELPAQSDEAARRRAAESALADARLEAGQAVFLNDLLNLPQPAEHLALYDAMENTKRNEGKQCVMSRLLITATRSRPVLVAVENVHWASETTLAHLAALSNTVAQCPALLVVTSRIEGDPLSHGWRDSAGQSPLDSIDLHALRKQESMELIAQFMDCSDPVVEGFVERAAGNPLFLEQLARTGANGITGALPTSIQSLIAARMDQLEPDHKHALQAASVIGQRFDLDLLRHLLNRKDYTCHELVERNLLRPEGTGYLFSHALIHEGVYHCLVRRSRRELHRMAAEWFADEDTTLYAQHLDKSDDDRAPRAYLEAAREQVGRYRFETALALMQRGLQLAPGTADRHEMRCFMAGLLLDMGKVEQAMTEYQRAREDSDDDRRLFDAQMGMAACLRVTTDYRRALDLLAKCEPIAHEHNLTLGLSRLTHLRGNLYFPLGNIDGCREEHSRALAFARQAASAQDEARALGGLGDAQYAQGRMNSAYTALSMCVEQCRAHGFGRIAVANRSLMGNSQMFLGDCRRAMQESSNAARAAAKVFHDRAEMSALVGVCNSAFELGEAARLETSAKRGLALAQKLGARTFEAVWHVSLSAVFYLQGDDESARTALAPAIRDVSAHSFVGAKAFGQLAMISRSPRARVQALEEGQRLLGEGTIGVGHLYFHRFAMEACLSAGAWAQVERHAQALEDYTRQEPLAWSDFFIARGRALAAYGRGNRDETTIEAVARLVDEARGLGLRTAATALENALSSV